MNTPSFPTCRTCLAALGATALLLAGGTGCAYFRNLGTGARMDRAEARRPTVDNRKRKMVLAVTTNGVGQVDNVSFIRSSGKESLDAIVVDSIRQNWPAQPSTRTVVELTYSRDENFSTPKVLSSTPIQ